MERCFLTPSALHRRIEPYKRLLGILLRPTCVSISISNQYLSLAEPAGAFLLRNGRVPERTLVRLLEPYVGELTGIVFGSESYPKYRDLIVAPPAAETLYQVHTVLHSLSPSLPYTWWDRWTPDTPASCRIDTSPPVGAQAGPQRQAMSSSGSSSGSNSNLRGGAQCSMGTLFLQHYLDNLGTLNTFG
ncbi:hypothetical protein Vretimale_18007 [Volvox reticuliferus]|uniref:Uncharacterized protein n=1 Tax=Volvox reticuliferus TaxID=1737510 RepID=A0A8J4GWE9_9CHLO|nr:hypothetical protein Vretifemale_17724 [Volvox reticuliferus]GIM15206.1 hypothetical protein Vretimale_18007 [Volvox reticuliferus]